MNRRWLFQVINFLMEDQMKGVLLWLVGVPIPVVILLYMFHVIN